jgi:hypothetical protein
MNTTFNATDNQDNGKNISDLSMNLNEANSSTPKVQFNIGDSANHPVATVTPLESEIDSGFISSEAVNVLELSKGSIDISNNVQFKDEDEIEVNIILDKNTAFKKLYSTQRENTWLLLIYLISVTNYC